MIRRSRSQSYLQRRSIPAAAASFLSSLLREATQGDGDDDRRRSTYDGRRNSLVGVRYKSMPDVKSADAARRATSKKAAPEADARRRDLESLERKVED
ncbi:hypothetical protein ACHAWF_013199 [Thalassiosira exigua]